MITAIYPGSFDPITLGHLNIIRRAAKIFDRVIVCVLTNAAKKPMFTQEERVGHIKSVVKRFGNVEVDTWNGLLVAYAARYEQPIIVRGLRALSDFETEFQMALINKKMSPQLETIFLTSVEKYTYLSSSAVKDMALFGADISEFVPYEIVDDVYEKSKQRRKEDKMNFPIG
jgi:pantetheine-phosphate adenylyltransferase